ncbi:MAG: DNA polymerase III subunit alpha [Deltaproteobacteria bacterium]|nr:MAG: DNA polymerase III subunit alpha [Deltaproteobacteria bacterium]
MAWIELCCQSAFSLLQGASLPEDLIETAAAAGLGGLAIVDRDGVYGLPRAWRAARAHDLQLICGATLTVEDQPSVVALVEDLSGWGALCRWLTRAHHRAAKGQASLELSHLAAGAPGITLLLRPGWTPQTAAALARAYPGRLGVLLSRQLGPGDARATEGALRLSRALGAPVVATNEVLYHSRDRSRVADVLTCIRRGCTLEQGGHALAANAERSLITEHEIRVKFADLPQAVDAAAAIAARCTFSLAELRYRYPHEVVPAGQTPMSWLRHLTEQGLERRYPGGLPAQVRERCEHELAIIERLQYPSYFLTVHDIVAFARSRGILCQGRGSAANSAVCYALGITAVDPSRASLLFERFISEERGEPPDIDVDFEHTRREEVLQYVYERYGRDRAALVNEVISYRLRSAIRDVGKVFGLSLDQVDRLAKCTDRWSAGQGVELRDLILEAGLDPDDHSVRHTLAYAGALKGLPRHLSIHVGGFVIADEPLTSLVPVEPAAMSGRTVIQWDKDDIDIVGFVKVDCLALGMLSAIRETFDLVYQTHGLDLDLATVPAEDPEVYEMFCRADTVGVFQIESRAQMSMLPRLRPRCFYDLVIEVAIVRPGPIQGGMVHPYLRRRSGDEPVTYAHPALRPVLERTLGVPLFQEQVMQMAVDVGGFTPGQADELRRAMAAWRKRGSMNAMAERLVQGMLARGISEEYAQRIFQQIHGFGEYGFPESHAASFALLVYVSGWLKCHHPAAFAAALVNSQPMGFYSPRALLLDAQRHGVEVRPICVQRSAWDCTLEPCSDGWAIRVGLRLIKGLAQEQAARLTQARDRAPFRDLADLARRTALPQDALQALAEANAFAAFGLDRRRAAWELQGLWASLPLFAGLRRNEPAPPLPPETPAQAIDTDYRRVGLSVDKHPMQLVRQARPELPSLAQVGELDGGQRVRCAGLVTSRQRPGTSKGVVFMTLEDETALLNLVVWPKIWSEHRRLARGAVLLGVEGVVQRQGRALSLRVERFWPVESTDLELQACSRDFH